MNREIKFRGKPVLAKLPSGQKVYGKFVYGDLITGNGICRIFVPIEGGFENHKVDPETVGQHTGLKDKNGTDVWEGDLLLTPERDIMVAEWQDAKIITKCVRPACPGYVNSLSFAYPVSEVIGNIYDNPELLEDGK